MFRSLGSGFRACWFTSDMTLLLQTSAPTFQRSWCGQICALHDHIHSINTTGRTCPIALQASKGLNPHTWPDHKATAHQGPQPTKAARHGRRSSEQVIFDSSRAKRRIISPRLGALQAFLDGELHGWTLRPIPFWILVYGIPKGQSASLTLVATFTV